MPINSDKPHLWKQDIAASVDLFNRWFMDFAPTAFRETRGKTTESVRSALELTRDLSSITPETLMLNPSVLPTLRMSTSPPLARDRLVGLAYASKNLVLSMELGRIPPKMPRNVLHEDLGRICMIIQRLLDKDIFPPLRSPAFS